MNKYLLLCLDRACALLLFETQSRRPKMAKPRNPKKDITSIRLCGVRGCCPVVEVHHGYNKIVITDDDGGKVTLTKEQWREALTKVNIDD